MVAKLTTEDFIDKAKTIHGDFYYYSKVEYKNTRTKITITCPIHGDFEQEANSHLRGHGCLKCRGDFVSNIQKSNKNEFIEKSKDIHGDKYDYSKVDYISSSDKVTITCPIHGDFEQEANSHLSGHGCGQCSSIQNGDRQSSNTKQFIEKAMSIHGDKYDYSKVYYKHNQRKVTINCPIHGDFQQKPNNHLNGQGCPKCADEHRGFWNPEYIQKYHSDRMEDPCTLYVIECYSEDERFTKVGITTKSIEERYCCESLLNGYQYDTLYEYHSTLIECSEIEQYILQQFKEYQYVPEYKFGGSSECIDIRQKDAILKTIEG